MSEHKRKIHHANIDTLFSTSLQSFPSLENDKIPSTNFLNAARGVLALVDKLGKVFAPVKYDMVGNITKLTTKYQEDPVKYMYLEDMILIEHEAGGVIATDALQWLRRGLHFFLRFIQCILTDDVDADESLSSLLKVAYTETLQMYHGWMGLQLFNLLCRFAPSRSEFFNILALGKTDAEEIVLKDMESFSTNLSNCILHLTDFYKEHDLEQNVRT